MKEEQIRVDMSTVHETGGYHVHSAHVNRSVFEAVVREVLADINEASVAAGETIEDLRKACDELGIPHRDGCNDGASRATKTADSAAEGTTGANESGADPEEPTFSPGYQNTISADSVRQLMDGLRVWTIRHWNDLPQNVREDWGYMVAEHYAAVAGVSFDPFPPDTGTVSAESPDTGDQADAGEDDPVKGASAEPCDISSVIMHKYRRFVNPSAGSGDAFCGPGSFEPAAPYGTPDAHLAEQMKDPEFRAEYLREAADERTDDDVSPRIHARFPCVLIGADGKPTSLSRESELRRAARQMLKWRDVICFRPGPVHSTEEVATVAQRFEADLDALKAALESKD